MKKRKSYFEMYDDKRRGTRERLFYNTKEWKKVRGLARERDNYLCQRCLGLGIIKPSELVHHEVEIIDDWSQRLTLSNLISLCHPCHQLEHSEKKSTAVGLYFDENGDLVRRE